MLRLMMLKCSLLLTTALLAGTITVKNIEELNAANKQAKPGDIIILQNGEWKNVLISLNCAGTKDQPVHFKAQTPGKVLITGLSQLKLGGSYIIVEGLYFTNGHAGDDAVIDFRIDKNQLANHCKVTNCVINDFNNPKRMDENNWVLFYGKNNSLDHCSFLNKKNMGVLLAVILDDERSRENFHSISHNYFGIRLPLASNGGEIIRVGVSQHCQFNSNTQITNNFFEHCDGEAEVISIKSGRNVVEENIFKECQGSVVLRHGDYNLVAGNFFIGNDKPGTGGVRVINKGQSVVSNIFYKCRGDGFRSPLAIMNGIPNSPAHRYVQVTEATISSNTFYECAPMSLGEGSDTERTLPPDDVNFSDNSFYNTRDSIIYRAWDDIGGILFANNKVSKYVDQGLVKGFEKTNIPKQRHNVIRNGSEPQYPYVDIIPVIEKEVYSSSGATWFTKKNNIKQAIPLAVNCATPEEVYRQLESKQPVTIRLTGKKYTLAKPFLISKPVLFTGDKKSTVTFNTDNILSLFIIGGNGNLSLQNINFNGTGVKATHFISSDSNGSSNHYNFSLRNCIIQNFSRENGCQNLFFAYKYILADSIIIRNNSFLNNSSNGIVMSEEKENRGYYNAEKIYINQNNFSKQNGVLLDVYRGGSDESTMGPLLIFTNNNIQGCTSNNGSPFIRLHGVQKSFIEKNAFTDCKNRSVLLRYEDLVRARHLFTNNKLTRSGSIVTNKFVQDERNIKQ